MLTMTAWNTQQTRTYTGLRLCKEGLRQRSDQLAIHNLPRGISVLDGTFREL